MGDGPAIGGAAWREAMERALRNPAGANEELLLFHEEREDLRVDAASGEELVSVHTARRGLSARATFGSTVRRCHVADPAPSDVEGLARAVSAATPGCPRRGSGHEPEAAALDAHQAGLLVSYLAEELPRRVRGVHAHARWVGFVQRVIVARQGGLTVEDVRRGARVRLEARLLRGTVSATAVSEAVLPPGVDPIADVARGLLDAVGARVVQRLDASHAPTGPAPAVFAPGVGGVLIHELVGHALEADVAARGSWLAGGGENVGSRRLTVVDDPRRGRASWRVDDEGVTARPTPLIRGGQVRGRLHDRATARAAGTPPTGHGRCSAYSEPVRPRMGCTFVAAGHAKPAELIGSVDRGVYVRRMEAATTDPRTGRAVFRVSDSDLLLEGRIDTPLKPHLLHVDGRDVLGSMDRIADDLQFDTCIGSCHRDGQPLAISVGAPTIRVGVINVWA